MAQRTVTIDLGRGRREKMRMAQGGLGREPVEERRSVLSAACARVEELCVTGLSRARTPTIHSPRFQVLFPLSGVFNWHLGDSRWLLDPNQILFIAAGDESSDSHPSVGDVRGLLVTPGPALLHSGWGPETSDLATAPTFTRRVLPSTPALQMAAAALARCRGAAFPPDDPILEEAVVGLLAAAAARGAGKARTPRPDSRLVCAVKEIVSTCEGRLSLPELADRLGRSPTYLTEAFRRSEGMPIARYHRRLRLARALCELPHTDDITGLALRFGFSSHAHFSAAFRSTFGRTPSEYRASARHRDLPSLLARLAPPAS